MDSKQSKKQKKEDILNGFVRFLHEKNHLDEKNAIAFVQAKELFKEYKMINHFTNICIRDMLNFPFITNIDGINRGILQFKTKRFDFLPQKEAKGKIVKIVDHRISFRPKTSVKNDFIKAIEKMKNDVKYAKEDVESLQLIESIRAERGDISSKNWNGLTVQVEQHTSLDNIIAKCNVRETVTLELTNSSGNNIHTIQEITQPLKSSAIITTDFTVPIYVKIKSSVKLPLKVLFTEHGDYVHYLILKHKSGKLLSIKMVFRVLPVSIVELQARKPYKRVSRVVYEERYEEIVPVDFKQKTAKVFNEDHEKRKPLQSYPLPPHMVLLLNMGLKDADHLQPANKLELNRIKSLLNVPNKHNPLTSTNYTDMLKLLLQMEEHQMWKDIHDYDAKDQTLKRIMNQFELEVPGLSEHRPSLIRGDSVFVKELETSTIKYEGKVDVVQETSVLLYFNKKFADTVYVEGKKFFVSFTFNRYPLRVEHQAIELVKDHRISSRFFDISKPVSCINQNKISELSWVNRDIESNTEQKQAVINIVQKSAYPSPYIIFGPPGTGKTATLVEAINQIYRTKPEDKMLVLAPSNPAADEIAARLIKTIPGSTLFRHLAMSFPYSKTREEIRPFTNYVQREFYQPTLKYLMKYRIVISTLSNSARLVNAGISPKHFSYVMIDEGGHATETETLISIAGILSEMKQPGSVSGQVVLVGDPKQLGAIIHSKQAEEYGFGTSMLERLMNTIPAYQKINGQYNTALITKLVNNYRSHKRILEIPNKLFYDGDLKTMGDHTVNVAMNWEELPNPKYPLIFHSVVGVDQREKNSPSFFNLQEVTVVLSYLKLLIGTKMKGIKISEEHIGVIAPYRKQAQKIKQICDKNFKRSEKLLIGSVEQLQGNERLIVIVSTTRSNAEHLKLDHKFHLGFLENPKRMNVALTRAKALLIVIGNPYILQYDDNWRQFIQYCQVNKCTKGAKFDLDDKLTLDLENMTSAIQSLGLGSDTKDNEQNPEGTVDFSRGQQ